MQAEVHAKVQDFFAGYPERHYPKGNVIVFADETPENIFFIVSGQVRQYDVSYRGDEVALNILKSPAFFSVGWALNGQPNKYAFKAESDSKLKIAPLKDIKNFLQDNPDVAIDLLSRLYRGIDGLMGRMSQLMVGTARSRIIYEIVIEVERSGSLLGKDTIINISETDLASRTALSRETVSREISKLRADDILEISGGTIKIKDLEALIAKLNPIRTNQELQASI